MAFNLSTANIYDLGETILSKLTKFGVVGNSVLTIHVQEDEFRKVDEDLFYRNRKDGEEFVPSEDEIYIEFGKLNIVVVKDRPQEAEYTLFEKWRKKLGF